MNSYIKIGGKLVAEGWKADLLFSGCVGAIFVAGIVLGVFLWGCA